MFYSTKDVEAPQLNCTDVMYNMDIGSSSATNVLIHPSAWDNADTSPEVVCSHSSQDVFPFGDTEVTCTSTDSSGNSDNCSFVVTVVGRKPN